MRVCAMPGYEGLRETCTTVNRSLCGTRPGFAVEVTDLLMQCIGLPYHFMFPTDRQFGAFYPNGSWDGMMGDLQRSRCDMTLPYMYPMRERLEAFDYLSFPLSYIHIMLMFNYNTLVAHSKLQWWKVLQPGAVGEF